MRRVTPWLPQWLERIAVSLASSRAGSWLYLHVATPIDRVLLPLTRGRLSVTIGAPILLLTTIGAKTGQRRMIPLLYLADGGHVVLVASNGGSPRHPAWYHNLRANPRARILARDRTGIYAAREATAAERTDLWRRVNDLFPGYARYQERTSGRQIPVMVLEPVES